MTGTEDNGAKRWAAMRLATIHEQQAIAALQEARDAYNKASEIKTEGFGSSNWAKVHAEDLADAIHQLKARCSRWKRTCDD